MPKRSKSNCWCNYGWYTSAWNSRFGSMVDTVCSYVWVSSHFCGAWILRWPLQQIGSIPSIISIDRPSIPYRSVMIDHRSSNILSISVSCDTGGAPYGLLMEDTEITVTPKVSVKDSTASSGPQRPKTGGDPSSTEIDQEASISLLLRGVG